MSHRRDLTGGWTSAGEHHCGDDNSRLAFDSAGDRLAVVSHTGIRVWDTASGRLIADIASAEASSASFSQDGGFLATTDTGRLTVWRLSAPDSPVFRRNLNGREPSGAVTWDPGKPVLRYLEAGSVHALDLGAAVTSAWRRNPLNNALLSPDGRTLATAEQADGVTSSGCGRPATGVCSARCRPCRSPLPPTATVRSSRATP